MSREVEFRVYIKPLKRCAKGYETILYHHQCNTRHSWTVNISPEEWYGGEDLIVEQYTGLKDKFGKKIYENCELDGRYRVEYIAPKFVGKDMVKGDIIELYDNKFTITKEHCEISQNSERGIN